jgi:hypothetical protein
MFLKRLAILSCVFLVTSSIHAQQASTEVTQDPAAVAFATKSLTALAGAAQISDVTLTGAATRVAGSDTGSGTFTLKALGISESRMDLNLSDGLRSEIRTSASGGPQGSWAGPNGSFNSMAVHNCLTDPAWFMPALSVLSQLSNPSLIAVYVGQETKDGVAVQHVHFALQSASPDPTGLIQSLSAEEVYLNASTFLPVALVFNSHPDNNANANIVVEIDFSNYQAVNGVQVPFRIQKLLNGNLFLDLTIQNVTLNSGLADSAFSIN